MLPIILDMKGVGIGVAGRGDGLKRKLDLVAGAGPEAPLVFEGRHPSDTDLSRLHILFVAGLDEADSARIASDARAHGVLVNVEDQPQLCDFHVPAQVKRGDLLLTISTGGRSPALARALRETLAERFGPEWESRLDELAKLRAELRARGASPSAISERSRAYLSGKGWL
jgi:precorrin-2 dehydrogenase